MISTYTPLLSSANMEVCTHNNRGYSIKQPLNSTRVNIYRELSRDLYYKSILGEAHLLLLTVKSTNNK